VKVVSGIYAPCPTCRAPYRVPLPAGWSYTVRPHWKVSHRVSVHSADCPDRFKAVVVPDGD